MKDAGVHLVEIDLIRRGPHVLDIPEAFLGSVRPFDYLIHIGRREGEKFEVYPVRLQDRLPRIRIPLKAGDADAALPLQPLLDEAYELLAMADRIDYSSDPAPPAVSRQDADWIGARLRDAGLRG